MFVAVSVLPHWLADAGEIFPVRHLADALRVAYNPHTTGLGFAGPDLLIVTREIPENGFPFVFYAAWRAIAKRRPFKCPECGAAVQAA